MPIPLQIFLAGTHTDTSGHTRTFSESDLSATARSYDPAKHEAPLVIGHPAMDDPAYGWVASLAMIDGALEATPRQVDPEFASLIESERFNKISSSFFMPDAPTNPSPGVFYLRHVGFLGAVPPAVKGMRKPSFALAEIDGTFTLEFALPQSREVCVVNDPIITPQALPASIDYAAVASALETENARLKAEIEAARQRQVRAEIAAFAETLIGQGRLLPRDKAGLTEFVATLPSGQTLEFAEGEIPIKADARIWLEDFLKRLPVQIDFSERTAGAAVPPPVGDDRHKADFAASADLQAEFGTEERYLAFQTATAAGKARILGSTK